MKYAIVDGYRCEALPASQGNCPSCGAAMVSKCGEVKIWHWAHRAKQDCDHWWEPETEWHRVWKNEFPEEWQECVQWSESGEKHIADVKTSHGVVIEFQHSYLKPEERRAREAFYRQMNWVVDGRRRKRDWQSFDNAMRLSRPVSSPFVTFAVATDESRILREWIESRVATLFDFGDASPLWRLDPRSSKDFAYLSPIFRTAFVSGLRSGTSYKGIPSMQIKPVRTPKRALAGFERHLARGYFARRRKRL